MKVKECMCNNVYSCSPNATVYDVAKTMQENHVGYIPICDEQNSVVGVVTDRDLVLRCIACDKDVKQTPISEIMTTKVWTCKPEDDMTNAQTTMGNNQVRRLPVVDDGEVVGILTMGDLAQNCQEIGHEEVSTTINNICDCQGENKNAE